MSTLRTTTDFLLYNWLYVNSVTQRPRFADHSREAFDAVLDICERMARDKFAPISWGARCAASKAAWATDNASEALANAVPFMQAAGHMVLAWMWLDIACSLLSRGAQVQAQANADTGRMAAMRYFFHYELPKVGPWLAVVKRRDMTCADMPVDAF